MTARSRSSGDRGPVILEILDCLSVSLSMGTSFAHHLKLGSWSRVCDCFIQGNEKNGDYILQSPLDE